ncbi:ribosome maturation factor RimP [Aeromicrobium sp.]|uniref:ribosome maturation factor RimP n=1 Tax=Aeromicrobium sp. TaxID=1871063 RepID=UPI0019C09D8D|nr:ribosome maturation factor RimP [Aeromicrobium sp.]MBC7633133.1 ribosome maturation factor RimP [Aeromicrobium sp.]
MTDSLETLVHECVSALGLDLEAVDLSKAGKRSVLRIAVDRDGGVGIDHITEATRELGLVLDESDVMGTQPYTLEVTSRGVERPLALPRHWRRNADRYVKVVLTDDSKVEGRITSSNDESVELAVKGQPVLLTYDHIKTALVQTELNRKDA